MEKEREGIKDLMERNRYRAKHLQKALIEGGVDGNWSIIQNVYNLINASVVPKDGYLYVFLSEFLSVDLKTVVMRYAKTEKSKDAFEDDDGDW